MLLYHQHGTISLYWCMYHVMYLQLFDICSIRIRKYNTIHSTHGTTEWENTYNIKYMYCSTIEPLIKTLWIKDTFILTTLVSDPIPVICPWYLEWWLDSTLLFIKFTLNTVSVAYICIIWEVVNSSEWWLIHANEHCNYETSK